MKKFFFFALAAVAMLTSCNKDETLATPELGAIAFENAFIDNATRAITPVDPSYNNTALMPNFNVYGFFDANYTDLLFDGRVVTVANGACSYSPVEYWAPSHTYYFQAIAPVSENWTLAKAGNLADAQKGPGVVTFTNIDGTEDLLYAKAVKTTDAEITAQPEKVGLTFQPLLSKVRFEFVNQFASETYSFEVKGVKITNAEATAKVDLVNENNHVYRWSDFTGDVELAFGDVKEMTQGVNDYAAEERMLIPYKYTTEDALNVTFDIILYANASVIDTFTHTVPVAVDLLMGYSYNFKATIDASNIGGDEESALYPIEFTVTEIETWVPYENDVDVENVTYTTLENVSVKAGETLTLTGHATVEGILNVAGTLDGAGYTMKAASPKVDAGTGTCQFINLAGEEVTVKDITIDGDYLVVDGKGVRNLLITKGGNYNFENVISKNATYALNTAVTGEAGKITIKNSTLQGWSSWGGTFEVYAENVNFTNGSKSNAIAPQGVSVLKNCKFDEGFEIHLDRDGFKSITFEGCTIGGRALAESDITEQPKATDAVVTILP